MPTTVSRALRQLSSCPHWTTGQLISTYFELLTNCVWKVRYTLRMSVASRYKGNTRLFSFSSTKLFLASHCLVLVIKINTASSCKVHGDQSRHAGLYVTLAEKLLLFSLHTIFRIFLYLYIFNVFIGNLFHTKHWKHENNYLITQPVYQWSCTHMCNMMSTAEEDLSQYLITCLRSHLNWSALLVLYLSPVTVDLVYISKSWCQKVLKKILTWVAH